MKLPTLAQLKEAAHHLIAPIGVLIFLQAPITTLLGFTGGSLMWLNYAFGAIGLVGALASKFVDSRSWTEIVTALSTPQEIAQVAAVVRGQTIPVPPALQLGSTPVAPAANPPLAG